MKRYVKEFLNDIVTQLTDEQYAKALVVLQHVKRGHITDYEAVREIIRIKEET